MRFTADKNDLAEAVTAVAQGLPARPRHPVHNGMLVYAAESGVIQLTASDGDTTFNRAIHADADRIKEPGSFVFPRIFPEIIRSLPGEVIELAVEDNQGTVTVGRSTFTFRVDEGEKYPFPIMDVPELGTVDGEEFRAALKKILPASDKDNPVPALTAVMLRIEDCLRLVATDKYTLATAECELSPDDRGYEGMITLLPARWADQIARMDGEQMKVGWTSGQVRVRSGSFTITTRTVDGQFPKQWSMILSMGESWGKLPEGLADAVKRASLTLGEKEPVSLSFGGGLTVSTEGAKGGFAETLPMQYDGEPCVLRTGVRMLTKALACCDQVCVMPGKPLLFRGDDVRYLIQVRRGNDVGDEPG